MKQILDLHIHSKYSRACSRDLELPNIARACEVHGIDVVLTGDFTHLKWIKHIKEKLEEVNEGVYKLKKTSLSSLSSALPAGRVEDDRPFGLAEIKNPLHRVDF